MASVIAPRPIAWVTTLDIGGRLNAAPFSFFNLFGDDPPTVALGIMLRGPGRLKDTAANIRARKEFVVNIVGEPEVEAMNNTSIDAPAGTSEADLFDIPVSPSVRIAPPRIASAPASFECRLSQSSISRTLKASSSGRRFMAMSAIASSSIPKSSIST